MKRLSISFSVLIVIGAGILGMAHVSNAQGQQPMDEAHIERIRSNCTTAKTTLDQLHANGGVLRVNRGQLYESILNKLMTPLNSRLTLNQLDSSELVRITAEFYDQLETFRDSYQAYEIQLSGTLDIDCQQQSVAFYDAVQRTRELRKELHADVVVLTESIKAYQAAFEEFKEAYVTENQEANNE